MAHRRRNATGSPGESPTRLKVVRIIARLNVGGPAGQVMVLRDRLPAFGFETLLVFGRVAPGEASFEDEVGTRRDDVLKIPELGRHIHLWDDVRAAWRLWSVVRRERPDIVHTHTSKAGVLGRLVATAYNLSHPRANRALVVHTFHGHVFSEYFGPVANRFVRWIERALARVTDIVVAISAEQRADLVERYRVARSDKVHIVPLGLDIDALLAVPRPEPASAEPRPLPVTFGFVGRFVPIKDLPTLVEAFALALTEQPHIRLRLFGGGLLRPAAEEQVRALGLVPQVEFAGWRLDRPEIYAGLDGVVLTSRNEGTPVALIEAHAAGLPVVATDVGGVRDVVRAEETGLLVQPGDVKAVADALVRLAASPILRWRMGQAGRLWVGQRFTAARLAENLNRLYRDGLARKRGAWSG